MDQHKQENVRLLIHLEGRVQGVGFRYFVARQAQQLGVYGWVRNTFDGDVEVLAEGSQNTLNQFLEIVKRGPQAALVTQVTQQWEAATGEFTTFSIRGSAY